MFYVHQLSRRAYRGNPYLLTITLHLLPGLCQRADVGLVCHHGIVLLHHIQARIVVDGTHGVDDGFNIRSGNVMAIGYFQPLDTIIG